ncbi:MAG: hypothetical protein ACRC7N_14690 [Clostridium sp.]
MNTNKKILLGFIISSILIILLSPIISEVLAISGTGLFACKYNVIQYSSIEVISRNISMALNMIGLIIFFVGIFIYYESK